MPRIIHNHQFCTGTLQTQGKIIMNRDTQAQTAVYELCDTDWEFRFCDLNAKF
jgi:hypothetical protein